MADIYSILAGKGKGDDKHLRMVDGEISHVNEVEKDAIDIYGLLGEIFTKEVGTGDINQKTGLPGYDWKYAYRGYGGKKKSREKSPHNRGHHEWLESGGEKHAPDPSGRSSTGIGTQGLSWQHQYPDQIQREQQENVLKKEGASLLDPAEGSDRINPDTGEAKTIGEMGLGQEALTAEEYQNMTPQQIVDDIFAKQYNNQVPPSWTVPEGYTGSEEQAFKEELAGRLKNMPKMEGMEGTDWYGIQDKASQVSQLARSTYGGTGVGMRGVVAGVRDIDRDIYKIEEGKGSEWAKRFTGFLGTLPSAA